MTATDELGALYDRGYNAGFDRGAEEMARQVEGIMAECSRADDAAFQVSLMLEDFWKERES